jgi:hypothetical protein
MITTSPQSSGTFLPFSGTRLTIAARAALHSRTLSTSAPGA